LILEDLPNIEAWSGIGTAYHGIPNRISYHLDLMGPSTAVDAACASSLIAVHLGRQAILSGESKVALAGGVNVLVAPGLTHMLNKAGALSPDGVCQSFDDDAHGYARGEGGAVIVLKDLASAIANHDNILAVLKGTATAQDGKTNGIFAPNPKAQEMVARQALARAGNMDPLTIGYVEAHATSTSLGDPTEVGAISNVYGVGRSQDAPCLIGSIKPNVGHLEAAAGAIGFVKAVLAVNKGELPPQARLNKLNTRVNWKDSGVKVVQEPTKWPDSYEIRRAAICSYGYGGSVSHAVIEQAPPTLANAHWERGHADDNTDVVPLLLTAPQEKRLVKQATVLLDWLSASGSNRNLADIATTLAQRRAHHNRRVSFLVRNRNEATESLRAFISGKPDSATVVGRAIDASKGVVWVFSGHGAQWPWMGQQLLSNAVFREAISALDRIVRDESGFSAVEALEKGDIGGTAKIQVLTFIVQLGLSRLLRSKGVEPQAIIGHSVGEIAASVVAGCLTPEEGAIIVTRRAKLYAQVEGKGGMALVNLPFSEVLSDLGSRRDIVAAINSSPSSCVVSGEVKALGEYVSSLAERDIRTFRVNTDIPFHCPMLEPLVDPLSRVLSGCLKPRLATVPLYSTSHADPRTESLRDVGYWTQNMVNPVRLLEAVEAAIDDGLQIFLEVSTHPIVAHSIGEALSTRQLDSATVFGIMKRNTPPEETISHAAAKLWTLGASVDFKTQLGVCSWARDVPGTSWAHKPYWKEVETGPISTTTVHDVDKHTLLGQRIDVAGSDTKIYTTTLDDKSKPYPLTHPLDGTEIIPAAVYCNTFRQATGASILDNLELRIPVAMTPEPSEVQLVVESDSIRLLSRLQSSQITEQTWINHSSSKWSQYDMTVYKITYAIPDIKKRIGTLLPNSFAWDFLQKIGVSGIAYPWAVIEHFGNSKEMIVKMDMDPRSSSLDWDALSWAPFLDAATSVGSSVFFDDPQMRIVSGIDRVLFVSEQAPPKTGYLFIEKANDAKSLAADISVLSEDGELLAKLQSMRFSDMEATQKSTAGVEGLAHQIAWVPPQFSERPLRLEHVILVSDDEELMEKYAVELRPGAKTIVHATSAETLKEPGVLSQKDTVVIYVPGRVLDMEAIPEKSFAFTWEAMNILKTLAEFPTPTKLFIITAGFQSGDSVTELAHAPLHGLGRIAAQEHPDIWGALVDNEGPNFPHIAVNYVQQQDIVRVQDGLPRVARLRALAPAQRYSADSKRTLLPKKKGTYIVTGGLGDLGIEVCNFLVEQGASRLVIISRRALPPRSQWNTLTGTMSSVVSKLRDLEDKGASVYTVALDIGSPTAPAELTSALDRLSLPPVLGVVHAAGVSEDNLILNTTSSSLFRVLSPKIAGALNLHRVFPPGTLDFFVLFSSIGQLVGTSGQSPYGAANAFLDALATHRRAMGDNSVAFQWTAWRGMGLAADSEFLTVELDSKGITDITPEEAFQAWEYVDKFDTDHAVITRLRALESNEAAPIPLVSDIAPRNPRPATKALDSTLPATPSAGSASSLPTSLPELQDYMSTKIRQAIASVLHITDIEDIDPRTPVADMGVDSVMTVSLTRELQRGVGDLLNAKVPPTLTWRCRDVRSLVDWFAGKVEEARLQV
jgi:6-methylsalicylic acid synthase